MSPNVQDITEARVGTAAADHSDGGVDVLDGVPVRHVRSSHDSPVALLWRALISMRTGLWLILVLGVLTLAGTLIVQAPADVLADRETFARWVELVARPAYGGWASVFAVLGLFGVFSTWYFKAIFALLAVSILACSINRAPRLWRVATRPRTSMSDTFFTHAPLQASFDLPADAATAADRVRAGLAAGRFRVLEGHAREGFDVYGDKFRWGPFGTVVAHLSFLIIMTGFVVSAALGFRVESFVAPVGVPVEVGHDTGMTAVAHSFVDSYYENGQPKDYVSDVSVLRGGAEVARHQVRVNDPLIVDDVWFHQANFGVGVDVTVKQGDEVLYSEMVPLQGRTEDGTRTYGGFEVPGKGLSVWVLQAASGQQLAALPAGTVEVEVHRDGVRQPLNKVITQGQPTDVGGFTVTFERPRVFTVLTVKRDPGSIFIWVGGILLVLGSCLVFFVPHRRVWAQVRPDEDGTSRVRLAAPLKRDPAFEPVFADIVHRIQAAG